MIQGLLFGREAPGFDGEFSAIERVSLREGAWLEVARGWVQGHARLFDELSATAEWRAERRQMYERTVDVPRLVAVLPAGHRPAVVEEMRAALNRRYRTDFARVSLAFYRDGRDSVAWHGDQVARRMESALVATVSLGAARKLLLRPKGGGPSLAYSLGWGDLLVMGGTCQRTYQHAIPKTTHAEPRIALMFRPVWMQP